MRNRVAQWFVAGSLALAATGCRQSPERIVDGAWVRLPAVPGRPAAAYFRVMGGRDATRLIGVEVDGARRSELHESGNGGMRRLADLPIPADTIVEFGPGGRHVMLFGLDPRLKAGARTTVRLVLGDGRRPAAPARVVGPADPAP